MFTTGKRPRENSGAMTYREKGVAWPKSSSLLTFLRHRSRRFSVAVVTFQPRLFEGLLSHLDFIRCSRAVSSSCRPLRRPFPAALSRGQASPLFLLITRDKRAIQLFLPRLSSRLVRRSLGGRPRMVSSPTSSFSLVLNNATKLLSQALFDERRSRNP